MSKVTGIMRALAAPGLSMIVLCLPATPCRAQQRPLKTDDPELVAVGRIRIEEGIDYLQGQQFPLSGLKGDLTRLGVTSVHVGVGEYAEFQLSGVIRDFLSITQRSTPVIPPTSQGNATSDFGDIVLATKLRLLGERGKRPALAFKFAVELPIETNESGLGTDEMQFFAAILASKTLGRAQLLGNLGLAILGSPVLPNTQADKLTYGFGIVLRLHRRFNLVGEVIGREGPERVGNENRAEARLGLRLLSGAVRWDVAGIAGLRRYDTNSGISLGLTYEFQAFGRIRKPKTVK
jgi:hypothetical protein